MLKFINNDERYFQFIKELRIHPENVGGFIEKVEITHQQQIEYMKKYSDKYYIALENDNPVGWIGQIDNDIRVCTHPQHKGKGIGKFMLNELIKIYPQSTARVLLDNLPSNKLFISCGFTKYKSDFNFNYYKK